MEPRVLIHEASLSNIKWEFPIHFRTIKLRIYLGITRSNNVGAVVRWLDQLSTALRGSEAEEPVHEIFQIFG